MKIKGKALILTYSGFQDQEVVYPYYRLLGENLQTDIVSDKRDALGRTYGILGVNMPCTILYNEFEKDLNKFHNDYNVLILPGGVKSLEKLRQRKDVLDFISDWHKQGKIISSTCHGAQLMISAKITKGRKITGYISIKDDIINSGAEYIDSPVVQDGNLVTSPHYDHMGIWMETTIDLFNKTK
jgi:protease I